MLDQATLTCVTGGINQQTDTECYNEVMHSWEVVPSLGLPTISNVDGGSLFHAYFTAINFGSISCLYGTLVMLCTNKSSLQWVQVASTPDFRYGASAIYGTNWVGVTTGDNMVTQSSSKNFITFASPAAWTTDPTTLDLNWAFSAMPVRFFSVVVNLNGTPCMSAGWTSAAGGSADQAHNVGSVCFAEEWAVAPFNVENLRHGATSLLIDGWWCVLGGIKSSLIECIEATADYRTASYTSANFTLPSSNFLDVTNITLYGLPCLTGGSDGYTTFPDVWCANGSVADNTIHWLHMPPLIAPRAGHASWTILTVDPPHVVSSKKPSTLVGMIVGCVVGGFVLLVLIICCVFAWRKKRRTKQLVNEQTVDTAPVDMDQLLPTAVKIALQHAQIEINELTDVTEKKRHHLLSKLESKNFQTSLSQYHIVPGTQQPVEIIDFSRIKQGDRLGSGEGGIVYKCTWDLDHWKKTLVLKVPFEHNSEQAGKEANTWGQCPPHPNVVRMLGRVVKDSKFYGIVIEYFEQGSLDKVPFQPSEVSTLDIAKQITRGLVHLHKAHIVHRDLALRNILIQEGQEKPRLAITDFGLSRSMEACTQFGLEIQDQHYISEKNTYLPWALLAPELLNRKRPLSPNSNRVLEFNEKTDVWALGVMLWELCSSSHSLRPYGDSNLKMDELRDAIVARTVKLNLQSIAKDCSDLLPAIVGCLQYNPADRPTAMEVLILLRDSQVEVEKTVKFHLRQTERRSYNNDISISNKS